MTIADLFINLGIKGAGPTDKQLKTVKGSLGEISVAGLAAKAAILAVVYGLEKMMSDSAKTGMGLQQFANFTGLSADMLQRWQYMMRQSGVSAEETEGSIKAVQDAMDKMNTGQGTPKGLEAIARSLQATGSSLDISRAVKDTTYMMDKLREYARTTSDTPQRANDWLSSFGLGPGFIQGIRTSKVELDKIPQSFLYTKNQIEKNAKVEVAWENLGAKVKKAFGDFTAKDGMKMVKQISDLTDHVIKFAEALERVIDKLHVIQAIGKILDVIGAGMDVITNQVEGTTKNLGGKAPTDEKGNLQYKSLSEYSGGKGNFLTSFIDKAVTNFKTAGTNFEKLKTSGAEFPAKAAGFATAGPAPNISVHQINHGVKGAKDSIDPLKKEIYHAHKTLKKNRVN